MTGMWSRWAARRRLTGLTLLGLAAVAIATAVLLYTLGNDSPASFILGLALSWTGVAIVCFIQAGVYMRRGRSDYQIRRKQ